MNAAEMLAQATCSRNKYFATHVRCDGYTFDSKAEYLRYLVLRDMVARGEIVDLAVHPRFCIVSPFRDWQGSRHRARFYEADFQYCDKSGKDWVEDVKGVRTREYILKRELFLSLYRGTCFREVEARRRTR
jgi:hypothetical protein